MESNLRYPVIENAKDIIVNHINIKTSELYGENLPEFIKSRLDIELQSINNEEFATVYLIAKRLTSYNPEIGQFSGVRASAGASFIAFLLGISGVNPLVPHYLCNECKHIELQVDTASGFDLPIENCTQCDNIVFGDGHNIPFEVFGGLNCEITPQISILTNLEESKKGKQNLECILNDYAIVQAGAISKNNKLYKNPSGFVIVPKKYVDDVPISYIDADKEIAVTSQDYHELTSYYLQNITGHFDINKLFYLAQEVGVSLDNIPMNNPELYKAFANCDTQSIREFETDFMINALGICKPECFSDLVKINGLGHSNGAWGSARMLIQAHDITLKEIISSRDDIFNYLSLKGMKREQAYNVMDVVMHGKGNTLTEDLFNNIDLPQWYLDSCKPIEFLFHKASSVFYTKMSVQLMWFKINHNEVYTRVLESDIWRE